MNTRDSKSKQKQLKLANELCKRNQQIYSNTGSEYERYYDRNKQFASERGARPAAQTTRHAPPVRSN